MILESALNYLELPLSSAHTSTEHPHTTEKCYHTLVPEFQTLSGCVDCVLVNVTPSLHHTFYIQAHNPSFYPFLQIFQTNTGTRYVASLERVHVYSNQAFWSLPL